MKNLKTQFGTSLSMNLMKNTWEFEMNSDFTAVAGEFAILTKSNYEELLNVLSKCENINVIAREHISDSLFKDIQQVKLKMYL